MRLPVQRNFPLISRFCLIPPSFPVDFPGSFETFRPFQPGAITYTFDRPSPVFILTLHNAHQNKTQTNLATNREPQTAKKEKTNMSCFYWVPFLWWFERRTTTTPTVCGRPTFQGKSAILLTVILCLPIGPTFEDQYLRPFWEFFQDQLFIPADKVAILKPQEVF